jgi:hypothetical protein
MDFALLPPLLMVVSQGDALALKAHNDECATLTGVSAPYFVPSVAYAAHYGRVYTSSLTGVSVSFCNDINLLSTGDLEPPRHPEKLAAGVDIYIDSLLTAPIPTKNFKYAYLTPVIYS